VMVIVPTSRETNWPFTTWVRPPQQQGEPGAVPWFTVTRWELLAPPS
jgi:hypothetical protein